MIVNSSRKNNGLIFTLIAVLALAGVIDSAFSLQRHYAKSATQFCDIGEKFNCDIVNRSEWSQVMGIPVAAVGVVGYLALLLLATAYRSRLQTPVLLLVAAGLGLAFALYLTYIEEFVLDAWCILCLISLALIAAITVLAATLKVRDRQLMRLNQLHR